MRTAPALAALALACAACGYRAVYGGGAVEGERLHVALVRSAVADAIAADEVVSGVREELAREGALAAGEGYPRVEIEVTRLDETSAGVAAVTAPDGTRAPRARGSEVGVVARAWLVRAAGGEHERDTGDMRAIDLATAPLDPTVAGAARVDALHHDDAVRAAAHRAGVLLGRRVLGAPVASDDAR